MDLNKLNFWDLMHLILFVCYWVVFPISYLFSKEPTSLWTAFMICVGVIELYYAITTLINIASPEEILQAKKHWNAIMQLRPRAITAIVILLGYTIVRISNIALKSNPESLHAFVALLFGAGLIILSARWWITEIPRNDTLFKFKIPELED